MTAELILCLLVAGFALGIALITAYKVRRRTTEYCNCTHPKIDHVTDGCTWYVANRHGHVHRCRCMHQWGYDFQRGDYA